MKTNKLVKKLIANGVSIQDLENWQRENFSTKDYIPLTMGVYWTLKPLSDKQIAKALKEMKRKY